MSRNVIAIRRSSLHTLATVVGLLLLIAIGSRFQVENTRFSSPEIVAAASPKYQADGREWSARLISIASAKSVSVQTIWDDDDAPAPVYETQGLWILARVEFVSKKDSSYAPDAAIQDSDGRQWTMSERVPSSAGQSLTPGIPVRVTYVLEIPKDAKAKYLILPPRAVNDSQVRIPIVIGEAATKVAKLPTRGELGAPQPVKVAENEVGG